MRHIRLRAGRRPPWPAAIALLLVGSTACRDAIEPGVTAPEAAAATVSSDQLVARALAIALSDESQRRFLHAALRDSRWMDHKVLLQDYVRTDRGGELAARAAAAVGLSESAFRTRVAELEPMDLYLPFREHRVAWRATDELLVVATRNLDPDEVVAYGPDGAGVLLRQADGVPSRAVLVMHPAEPRIRLVREAIHTSGDAIELPQDARKGTEIELAMLEPCDPYAIFCEEPPPPPPPLPPPSPPPPPPPGDYLTYFLVSEDDGFLGGTMEMEFRNGFGGPVPPFCAYNVIAYSGVHKNWAYNVNILLVPAADIWRCLTLERTISVWEMDGGSASLNQNDFFGSRRNAANFGQPREIYYNFPMGFFVWGSHKAELTIVSR